MTHECCHTNLTSATSSHKPPNNIVILSKPFKSKKLAEQARLKYPD
jgi:hypothetical protein